MSKAIDVNLSWDAFRSHPLCKSGVLIWLDDSTDQPTLIGDVNGLGGGCDCCSVIERDTIVRKALDLNDAIASTASDERSGT